MGVEAKVRLYGSDLQSIPTQRVLSIISSVIGVFFGAAGTFESGLFYILGVLIDWRHANESWS